MNEHDLKHIFEATLLAAGRPVTTQQLLDLFDERERPTPEQAREALDLLAADYAERGIEVVEVASGWRIQVRPRTAEVVSRLWQERPSRYSRALLETLALIAYRQPITRSEIEEIRGVSISSTIMRTLQERNWIRTVGHREVPGRPELLGTTRDFLDYFGLKSLDQLPTLAELKDVETIGVQLELPSPEGAAEAADGESADQDAAAAGEASAEQGEGAEATADEASADQGEAAEATTADEGSADQTHAATGEESADQAEAAAGEELGQTPGPQDSEQAAAEEGEHSSDPDELEQISDQEDASVEAALLEGRLEEHGDVAEASAAGSQDADDTDDADESDASDESDGDDDAGLNPELVAAPGS